MSEIIENLKKKVESLEKRIAAIEGQTQKQPISIKEFVKESLREKLIDKSTDALNRLLQGKSSINQIRVEYGFEPIKDKFADELFITIE